MTSTVEKYLSQILEGTHSTGIYAYRGQQDSQWPLHSAATRRLITEHGEGVTQDPDFPQIYVAYHRYTLIEPARTRGFGTESGRRLSDLELLAKLQHFGAATGLLDFTWSPLIALWFASQYPPHDGKLFVVNTNDPISVVRISSDEKAQDLEAAFLGAVSPPYLSYWEPTVTGDASLRILRQRSVFIIDRPLVPSDKEVIRELLIAKEDKQALQSELEVLDFSQESLFQDVYGFAQVSNLRPVPPLTAQAYARKGNLNYQRQEYTEAIAAYSRSIELAHDVALTYLLRGNAFAATGRHQEAIEDYNIVEAKLMQSNCSNWDTVYFNRGNSKAELSDYEGALRDYTEAINLSPNLVQGYYNRGNIYLDLYRFEEALLDYDHIIGKRAWGACFNKANALLALGRLPEARSAYQESISKGTDRDSAAHNLGVVDQLMALTDGFEYTVTATPHKDAGIMYLRFGVSGNAEEMSQALQLLPFVGRTGNVGNTGGPNLKGGEGLEGKTGGIVSIDFRKRTTD